MASDLSNIIKDELANTLEQLLSKSSNIQNTSFLESNDFESSQAIRAKVKFEFKDISSSWSFLIPTISATNFEYFMLGGMGDLKEHIDDEISDAVNEIVSNICGSIATSINAQGFSDVSNVKFESFGSEIIDGADISSMENVYSFSVSMDDDLLPVLISFDEIILPFVSGITGKEVATEPAPNIQNNDTTPSINDNGSSASSNLLSLLGEESIENLKLLFNIKLKLSVRLGTKMFLLKDILKWDIGEIIELEQMVNEPLDILINGVKIGEGEAVVVEGKFGLKIRNIGNDKLNLSQIGIG